MRFVAAEVMKNSKGNKDERISDELTKKSIKLQAQFDLIGQIAEETLSKNDEQISARQVDGGKIDFFQIE